MQRLITLMTVFGMMLFASIALAQKDSTTIGNVPDKGSVTVSGTVKSVKNAREFTLHDNSGDINVRIVSNESMVLKKDDNVTVSGTVEKPLWGLLGKKIAATTIQVHKDLPTALSDAFTKTTGISMEKAEAAKIGTLPDNGMVQLTGTVEKVSNEKNFRLQDGTGSIDVSIKSDENVVLTQGAEVTVVGYVNKSVFTKTLQATRVIVMTDAVPASGQ